MFVLNNITPEAEMIQGMFDAITSFMKICDYFFSRKANSVYRTFRVCSSPQK